MFLTIFQESKYVGMLNMANIVRGSLSKYVRTIWVQTEHQEGLCKIAFFVRYCRTFCSYLQCWCWISFLHIMIKNSTILWWEKVDQNLCIKIPGIDGVGRNPLHNWPKGVAFQAQNQFLAKPLFLQNWFLFWNSLFPPPLLVTEDCQKS